jgi:hypothetical protein
MPGASDNTRRIKVLNANWNVGESGRDGRFEPPRSPSASVPRAREARASVRSQPSSTPTRRRPFMVASSGGPPPSAPSSAGLPDNRARSYLRPTLVLRWRTHVAPNWAPPPGRSRYRRTSTTRGWRRRADGSSCRSTSAGAARRSPTTSTIRLIAPASMSRSSAKEPQTTSGITSNQIGCTSSGANWFSRRRSGTRGQVGSAATAAAHRC